MNLPRILYDRKTKLFLIKSIVTTHIRFVCGGSNLMPSTIIVHIYARAKAKSEHVRAILVRSGDVVGLLSILCRLDQQSTPKIAIEAKGR